jgi:hypothetical protein
MIPSAMPPACGSPKSKRQYQSAWRRFLGFLTIEEPAALVIAPLQRLTIERIRAFASHLGATNTPRSVAIQIDALYKATRAMMPQHDWTWLKSVKARLNAAGHRILPPGRSSPACSFSTLAKN